MCTRTAKLLPHLWYHPAHIIYVPFWIIFGYYLCVSSTPWECGSADPFLSAIMKLYAVCTLHETGWGTRAGIGDRESSLAACGRVSAETQLRPLPPLRKSCPR